MPFARWLLIAAATLATAPAHAQLEESYADEKRAPTPSPSVTPAKAPPEPIPPGYHIEERPRASEVVWGSTLLGLGLLSGALAGFSLATGETVRSGSDVQLLLVGCGVGVLIGVPLIAHGLLAGPKKVLVRDAPRVFVAPIVAQHMVGSSFAITFW